MVKKRGRSGAELPLIDILTAMYNRNEQLEILKSVKVPEGRSLTMDCPFCHGKRKFSITNDDGTLLWNCYRASCNARGAYRKGMTLQRLKGRLEGTTESLGAYIQRRIKEDGICLSRRLPEILGKPDPHPEVMEYLEANGCLESYLSGLIKIRYSPADNRVLFFMNDGQGAVGRALDNRKPKWLSYGNTTGVLTVGTGPIAVIVEDAPSACAVARLDNYTGIAILGTNLSTKQKQIVKAYQQCIICLDRDAGRKALKLLEQLQGAVQTTVRFLNSDLKGCSVETIKKVLINEV